MVLLQILHCIVVLCTRPIEFIRFTRVMSKKNKGEVLFVLWHSERVRTSSTFSLSRENIRIMRTNLP